MIRIFKSNHPVTIAFLVFYILLLKLNYFINPLPFNFNTNAPLGNLFYRVVFFIFGNNPYWENVIVIFFILVQAILLNQVANDYKITPKTSYLVALSFVLLNSLFWEFSILSSAMLANIFLILIIRILFSIYKKEKAPAEIFNIGFFLGISTLIYFPMFFFLLLIYVAILILRPFNLKEWIIVLIGLTISYFLIGTYYFWKGDLYIFIRNQFVLPFISYSSKIVFNNTLLIPAGIVAAFSLWGFYFVQIYFNKSIVQWKKFMNVFIWMVPVGFFSFVIQSDLSLTHFILLLIPLSVFISFLLAAVKKNWLSEAIHLILLLTILFFQYGSKIF